MRKNAWRLTGLTFAFGCVFQMGICWNEAVIGDEGHVVHLAYRYHFQDEANKLVFRYDNTSHFPGLKTFPNQKHLPESVIPANRPSVREVLDEVNEELSL
jgi:hypothetical protein